ncbi:hypothetical protein ACU4HD_46005 [Cupriavidus basilensis]
MPSAGQPAGAPLTATLFSAHGKFTGMDVEMTRQALTSYGVGLIGLIESSRSWRTPGFYPHGRTSARR